MTLHHYVSLTDWAFAELWTDDIRARAAARESGYRSRQKSQQTQRNPNVRLVPLQTRSNGRDGRFNKNATFGQRRTATSAPKGKGKMRDDDVVNYGADGGIEVTFMPSGIPDADDSAMNNHSKKADRRKGVEVFGAGMEKGGEDPDAALSEADRKGRTQRRKGMRSGSKNTFRRM